MFDKLFTPITIKDMTLRNRIIMPAMGTRFTEDRFVNEKHIAYHVARARGGSALNIVEVSSVHALSAPKMFLSIAEDKYIPKLKELTDAIHAEGGKAGIQLWQGGLAVSMDQTAMILLSSDTELAPGFTVPGISKEMIAEVVDCYGKAAARAVAAGFDCIEFHCAHNYLPHSFLSDGLNHRTDAYGGSLENRARFPLECIRAIRASMPEGMPLFMRIDAQDDGFGEAGLTVEDTITFCNWAKDAGVDVLDVSRGNIVTAASKYEVPPLDLPRGFNVDNAARIRKGTGMLTIGVGRINDPQQAKDILEADKVDKAFRYWNVLTDCWEVEGGNYQLLVGASVQDIRLRAELALPGTGAPDPYASKALPHYQTGEITDIPDAEFEALLGRSVPKEKTAIDRTMTLGELHHSRSPLCWLIAGVLTMLLRSGEKNGKPNLNILFQYNMPLRGLAQMTGGIIGEETVDGLVLEAKGFWVVGILRALVGLLQNYVANSRY